MAEIDMPPQYAGGDYPDPKDAEGKVVAALATLAHDRVTMWATFVLDAISEFETAANDHIDQLQYDHDATYDFNPVLASFAKVVVDTVPFTKEGAAVLEPIMEGMQSSYEHNLADALTGAKQKLHGSVAALVQAARLQMTQAAPKMQEQVPKSAEDAMTWVDSASTNPDYVSALCDWMGCPLPTRENTVNPVRQSLENPFFGVYVGVVAQLKSAEGVPGLTDDDLDPIRWEHDGIVRQKELYDSYDDSEKAKAWTTSYDEIARPTS
jgi:hypothetical protein